jgi:hypothetical protein
MFNKLKKYEEITDRVEVEVASYLDKLSTKKLVKKHLLKFEYVEHYK